MFDIDQQLSELLEVNQRMLKACKEEKWDKVSRMDEERLHLSEKLKDIPSVQATVSSSEKIVEIISTDEKITALVKDARQKKADFIRKARQKEEKIRLYQDGS